MAIRVYRGREFEVVDEVYDPAEDSFLLAEAALSEIRPADRVLEVGTGSGIISFTVSEKTVAIATDISPHACKNARINGVEVVRTDLFDGICGQFDVVIFNPPYLPTADDEKIRGWLNRAFDGGPDGRAVIKRFLAGIKRILPVGGRVLTIFSTLTDAEAVCELYRQHGFSIEIAAQEKVPFETIIVLRCVRVQ